MHLLIKWPHVMYLKPYLYALAMRPYPARWLQSGLAVVYSHSPGSTLQEPDWYIKQRHDRDHSPCVLEVLKGGTDFYLP